MGSFEDFLQKHPSYESATKEMSKAACYSLSRRKESTRTMGRLGPSGR